MKIYTGVGDRGRTSLFSGERVAKSDPRIEAYGDVDELNSHLGALIASLDPGWEDLAEALTRIQSDLLHVGAWMATTAGSRALESLTKIGSDDIARLESSIDRLQTDLPELTRFILPGGHPSAAWAHLARTVCRRAERRFVALHGATGTADSPELSAPGEPSTSDEGPPGHVLVYMNRLSDYLFVVARTCNRRSGVGDQLWEEK